MDGNMRNGVDLARAAISDEQAVRAQEMLERKLGKRCGGCGRRIGVGIKFTSVDPRAKQPVMQIAACSRDDCGFMEQCRDGATFMEAFECVWLDDNGVDASTAAARAQASD